MDTIFETVTGNTASVVAAQRTFFRTAKSKDVSFRIKQLKKLYSLIHQHEERITEALHKDLGRHPYESLSVELGPVYSDLKHLIRHTREWSRPEYVKTSLFHTPGTSRIYSEPYGNVLVIAPWNYPLLLSISPIAGAMSAGNCVVLKPSEHAPHTSALLCDLINNNFDAGYLHVVEGGVETNQQLLAEKWDYIFFTGGTEIGRIIYQAAAKHLTPVTLELGGKSPCVVDKNVSVRTAAKRIVWGKFVNQGQTCIAPDYLFVHRDVKDKFIAAMKEAITSLYGSEPLESGSIGRIINQRQYDRLKTYLDNGEIISGGKYNDAQLVIEPTLMVNAPYDSRVMTEEIFGPILPIYEYSDLEEVIRFVNDRDKPLAAYIFSRSASVRERFITSTSSGGVTENDTMMHISSGEMPFGGVGNSGMGGYHGKFSFDTFSHKRSVLHRMSQPLDNFLRYAPYSKAKMGLMRWMLKRFL